MTVATRLTTTPGETHPRVPCMSLREVAAFVEVADQRSFRRAGERLYLEASSVSRLVRRLEEDLGAPLLKRSTRRVSLTPQGAATLGAARDLLRAATELVTAARPRG